jgi:pimeloyl-ACP methyl ester carboxylesterase
MILNVLEAGSGLPVVLLHGLFGAAQNFGAIQRRLAANWRVLALDLRNHGASPHGFGMTYDSMADDVLETLRQRDARPCALVGHSMGGKVAMRTALRAPDDVACLAVCDIAPVPYKPAFREFAAAMARLDLSAGATRAALDAALADTVTEPGVRAFLLQNARLGKAAGWRIGLTEIAAGLPDIEDWPEPIGAAYAGPTLFISGARSNYVRPDHRPIIRQWFPAARFVQLKDAGHWLHADNPDGFLSVLDAFLKGWK